MYLWEKYNIYILFELIIFYSISIKLSNKSVSTGTQFICFKPNTQFAPWKKTNVALSASYRKEYIHSYVFHNDFKSILDHSYTGILYSQISIQNCDSLDPLPTALVLGTKICPLYKCSVSVFFSGIYHGLVVHRTYGKLWTVHKFYIALNFKHFTLCFIFFQNIELQPVLGYI